jgi:hypothetical protein
MDEVRVEVEISCLPLSSRRCDARTGPHYLGSASKFLARRIHRRCQAASFINALSTGGGGAEWSLEIIS